MGTSGDERHARGWSRGLLALAATICLAWGLPALAQAASMPAIDSTSVAHIRQNAAAIEAQIDPEGSATTYEVWVWPGCSAGFCERGPPYVAATGHIPAGSGDRAVSAWVSELEAGASNNGYWVVATNASGTTESAHLTFTTPPAVAEPAIEGESVADITQSDATLEAKINPEGLDYGAYYQFQVVRNTSEYLPELVCFERGVELAIARDGCLGPPSAPPGAIPLHYISGGAEGQQVSLDLASVGVMLQPGTTYHYRVLAARHLLSEDTVHWEGPAAVGPDRTFTTPPAAIAPAIDSISLSHLTPTDATLEAKIDTEGLATLYQFHLISSPCSKHGSGCELVIPIPLPSGLLLGSFVDQSVSLDLASVGVTLGEEGEYHYSLSATSAAGSAFRDGGTFEAPPGGVFEPLGPSAASSHSGSGQGQPAVTDDGDQPAGSGDSLSSSTPGGGVLGNKGGKAIKPDVLSREQKLAKALKLCEKKPKRQQAGCERLARKKYRMATGKQR